MTDAQQLIHGDPRWLGSYEILGRLGEGGQGVMYLARLGEPGPPAPDPDARLYAIKLLRAHLSQDEASRARFLREVEAAKRVAPFCTAQVMDSDMAGDSPYIVSEYIPGPSLSEVVKQEGPRSGPALERIAINTATALAGIHQAGVVHRDFKPANVLMGPDGPVVIDFGIARALDAVDAAATSTGQVVGTPAYMAPEQLNEGPTGPPADIFAWGVTIAYSAAGTLPFGGTSIPVVINRILNEPPDLDAMTGPLRDLVAACLAKDPAERPTARQIVDRLLGSPIPGSSMVPPVAMPTPGPVPAPTPIMAAAGTAVDGPANGRSARRGLLWAGAGAVALVLAGGAAFALTRSPGTPADASSTAGSRPAGIGASASTTSRGGSFGTPSKGTPPTSRLGGVTTPSPPHGTRRPDTAPPRTTAAPSTPDPYTATEVCGSGYDVIDSHALSGGTVYLLYKPANGSNCVTTMRARSSGKVPMNATLAVQGATSASDPGGYSFYAGPVTLTASATCVKWGGAIAGSAWTSGWSHCG